MKFLKLTRTHGQLVHRTACCTVTSTISSLICPWFSVRHLKLLTDSVCSSSGELFSCYPGTSSTLNIPSPLPEECVQSDLFLDTHPVIYSCNTHSPIAPPHTRGQAVPRVQKVWSLSGGLQLTESRTVSLRYDYGDRQSHPICPPSIYSICTFVFHGHYSADLIGYRYRINA